MAMNGFAALVKQRSTGGVKRRRLDDYETPEEDSLIGFQHMPKPANAVFEPACGSGRMVRAIKRQWKGVRVVGSDIKTGDDFLKRTRKFPGDIITNPPYRDGLAERFVRHALKLADGRVSMLMQSGFLWGSDRAEGLYADAKPDRIIIMPSRIYFYEAGKQIKSQFYNHVWVCWPDRKTREKGKYETVTIWPDMTGF